MSNLEFNAKGLFDIACLLKPAYDHQQDCYGAFLDEPDSDFKYKLWQDSVKAYHKLLIKHSGEIGKYMTIHASYVRMLMGVRDGMIIWSPHHLLQAANYERMNPNYWVHPRAVQKNNFQFDKAISP